MGFQLIRVVKNIAGKPRYMVTITGIIFAWCVGLIFMPRNKDNVTNSKLEGIWISNNGKEHKTMQIMSSGYFYFDDKIENGKVVQYRGVITEPMDQNLILKSFNGDTLIYHKIELVNKNELLLKSKKDLTTLNFSKQ